MIWTTSLNHSGYPPSFMIIRMHKQCLKSGVFIGVDIVCLYQHGAICHMGQKHLMDPMRIVL